MKCRQRKFASPSTKPVTCTTTLACARCTAPLNTSLVYCEEGAARRDNPAPESHFGKKHGSPPRFAPRYLREDWSRTGHLAKAFDTEDLARLQTPSAELILAERDERCASRDYRYQRAGQVDNLPNTGVEAYF